MSQDWNERIPVEPSEFYSDFGYLSHPRTRKPVTALTDYQLETWRALLDHKRILEVKSNKVGESTKWLIADFQLAVLPSSHPLSCRGYDQLIIAQTKDHAKEHIRTLRKLIIDSPKYSKYLINKPNEISENANNDIKSILKDEQSKTSVVYIYNPENPAKPSRIICLGIENDGAILSWKNIHHIHMSDVTAAEGDITAGVDAAMTRLANTDGSMVIETVPGDNKGRIFEMFKQYAAKPWKTGDYKVYTVTAEQAVTAGIMTREFLDAEKLRLGVMFPRYYEAQFMAGAGNIFPYNLLEKCIQDIEPKLSTGYKGLALDPSYGSSSFGVVGGEKIDGKVYIRYAEEFSRPDPITMFEEVGKLGQEYDRNIAVDSARPGDIRALNEHYQVSCMPINFRELLSDMTANAAQAVKDGRVVIPSKFKALTSQLIAVQYNDKGHPDKTKMNFDLGDAFLMLIYLLDNGQANYALFDEDNKIIAQSGPAEVSNGSGAVFND